MSKREAGFSIAEVLIAVCIAAVISFAAISVISSVFQNTRRTNDHMTANFNLEQMGYWVSRDVRMGAIITTEDLTAPAILLINWTIPGYGQENIYHSILYSIEEVTAGIGKLKRVHVDSTGVNEEMIVAEYIYYDTSDPANSTLLEYTNPVLEFRVAARLGQVQESKEFAVSRRPNY